MMSRSMKVTTLLAFLCLVPALALAGGIPFPPNCTCNVAIVQNPCRPLCITNFTPYVVRLCPGTASPVFDFVTFNVTVLDVMAQPVTGATVSPYELSGTLNMANGGFTTATTSSSGQATITVANGSGCGRLGVCADGVLICEVNARSPDIANSGLPSGCMLPTTATSFVNSNDKNNPSCGFTIHFGPVTPGMNDCWDLNCDNIVNSTDTNGGFVAGCGFGSGWVSHFGHGGVLGAKSTCP